MGAGGSCCESTAEDDDKNIVKLDLSHNGCVEVPPIVFESERFLENLNLSQNRILSLPPQLFHCQELRHVNLTDNGLDIIPPAIGSLLHLVSLKLDKNCIKDLPDNLKTCRKLKRLSLNNNQTLHQLPGVVTQLISLEDLYLNDCDLSFLPASIGRLTKLKVLELRNNRLNKLPLSMNRITSLTRLDLGDNSFEVTPECLPSFGALQELLMDNNDLEVISGEGLKKLEHLDVSYNNLKSIAKDIGYCTTLTHLNLGWNYLEALPDSVSHLTQLEYLVIEMNEITNLPRNLGKMSRLEELNVSNNRLCDLPSSIGLLRNLAVVNFSRNYVQEIPCEIGSCCRLSIINASYNRLQSLPAEVGYLANLRVLDLVGNFLMYLPISMSNLTGVRAIWLSANQNVPLIPFTEDVSMASGEKFLTNIALPQLGESALPPVEVSEPVEKTSWRRKIRFEEDHEILPRKMDRIPTPFPKELRCPTRKTQRTDDNYANVVDGRVPVFQAPQPTSSATTASSAVTVVDSNVAMIREANIRRNKDSIENTDVRDESEHESQWNGVASLNNDLPLEVDTHNDEHVQRETEEDQDGSPQDTGYSSATDVQEPVYTNGIDQMNGDVRQERCDNGRMSPIREEDAVIRQESKLHDSENGGYYRDEKHQENTVDDVSIDSFESESKRGTSENNVVNHGTENSRNQVIYSNLHDGSPFYQQLPQQDCRNSHSGYYTPPHRPSPSPYMTDGGDAYVPYRNNVNSVGVRAPPPPTRQTPSPYGVIRQSPVVRFHDNGNQDPVRQSPYGTVLRQSPRILDNSSNESTDFTRQSPYGTVLRQNSVTDMEVHRQMSINMVRQNTIETMENLRHSPYGTVVRQNSFDGHESHMQQSSYGTARQSSVELYGTARQTGRYVDNGNIVQDLHERPPSKQEMLSIAERNISQNIAPPCYEIAKMYSTKAALFEHCHRPN